MSIVTGIARFSKDSVNSIVNTVSKVNKGTVEATSGLLKGELSLVSAAKKSTGHISLSKFISSLQKQQIPLFLDLSQSSKKSSTVAMMTKSRRQIWSCL